MKEELADTLKNLLREEVIKTFTIYLAILKVDPNFNIDIFIREMRKELMTPIEV